MEPKENVLYYPVMMNSISKCGLNPLAHEKKPLSLSFLSKIFPFVLVLVGVSHTSNLVCSQQQELQFWHVFYDKSCVVAPHTHCIQKGAANSPQSMP